MKWQKLGLVLNALDHQLPWAKNSALTPTPILLNEDVIRVYFGARDDKGISRIRYVDLQAQDPRKILYVAKKPVLDVGLPGLFDDNGVIMGDIIEINGHYVMFYVGFQLVDKIKFLAFTGAAVSDDEGQSFKRISNVPILDRSDEGYYIRAVHRILKEKDGFRLWYSVGNHWQNIAGLSYPSYYIKQIDVKDPFKIIGTGQDSILLTGNEYRIGRPRAYKLNNTYELFYTKGEKDQSYLPGVAFSKNGTEWKREDEKLGITLSAAGWDSETLCYPSLLTVHDKTYMFYNGNKMGIDGFGIALLEGNSHKKIYI